MDPDQDKTDDLLASLGDVGTEVGSENPSDNDWEIVLSLETSLQLMEESSGSSIVDVYNGTGVDRIVEICRGRAIPSHLRGKVWKVLLTDGMQVRHEELISVFEMSSDQMSLRNDCQRFVESANLSNPPEDHPALTSLLESVLSTFMKTTTEQYVQEKNLYYLHLLKPLVTQISNENDLYVCFINLVRDYIPRDVLNKDGLPFHIFRLLLLYHEPEACSLMDSLRISSSSFAKGWFATMLSSAIANLESVLVLWDIYFQYRDPFLIYFLGIVLVVNAKDHLLEMKNSPGGSSQEALAEYLTNLPRDLQPDDVVDFVSIAAHYLRSTPNTFRRMFESNLYGSESYLTINTISNSSSPCRRVAMQSLCLPVSAEELLTSIRYAMSSNDEGSETSDYGPASCSSLQKSDCVRFLWDCRPAEQYNAGHLPTAFHLDCGLMLLEPVQFSTAVQGLLLAQKEAISVGSIAGGEHLCFVGSGREEEDQYVHMVVSSFLQRHTMRVSLLSGGYQSLHELMFSEDLSVNLADHDVTKCPECINQHHQETKKQSPEPNLLQKLQQTKKFLPSLSALKAKSVDLKGKFIDYIQQSPELSHVSATDRGKSKVYRGIANVFSIEDEEDDPYSSDELIESLDPNKELLNSLVKLKSFLKSEGILGYYHCSEVMANGENFVGYVVVTDTHLYFVREIDNVKGEVTVARLLNSVIKITSKKKHPELITFKYGHLIGDSEASAADAIGSLSDAQSPADGPEKTDSPSDSALITHSDRFYLPKNSKEFVALVKKVIDKGAETA
ncbi:TBC1 domain family member 23 [Orchesella cincta]|uniref:TBC1 domain family member 23 n=1 Tax=Orchesella cincta TaxID=48709 RepID=A0A1D2MXM5_ORCCI|nr:TBC1 domain family member 23 [Orchesella cincta]